MSEDNVTVPDFQSMMLPCLQALADGRERSAQTLYLEVADRMGISEQQRSLRHEKRGTSICNTNINFAASYLYMAGLLAKPKRACFQIVEAGQALLKKKPERISIRFLVENYPSFAERQKQWRKPTEKAVDKENGDTSGFLTETPPEDTLEKAHSILCSDLARELLDQVRRSHWKFLERLVVELLTKMGYGGSRHDAAKVIGKSGDNGIDGIINEDKLGLDVIYVQAKRHEQPISEPQVRDFSGALDGKSATKGVFITTSSFTKPADEYVARIGNKKIILIDGQRLAELMIEYNVGVAIKETYEVKRIDYDYFDESEL